ncbi:ankyrin repeat domain-containing protein [Paraburkholderia sediminicola]|uniref:ankyrin repeat domain-containing protein n=1 Tax=Paraburkholderia sediminicola TaxID=458836 RepID=UPI0038B82057
MSSAQTDQTINGDKRGRDMEKMVTTTYTQWSLNSIYGRDDVDRLRRIFATLNQLAGETVVKEWALEALWDASEMNAPECSNWLAKIAAGERSRPNPPALHIAINNGEVSAAKFLARHSLKREIVAIADVGLQQAASEDDPELVEIFLPHANVNKAMDRGKTALMAASFRGSLALRALLPHANREQRDKEGFNALMHAIRHCNEEALALLIHDASEKEINGKIKGGMSARELAKAVQKDEWWLRLPVFIRPRRPFRPLDIMMPRIEFFEIGKAAELARASGCRPSSLEGRGPRRL